MRPDTRLTAGGFALVAVCYGLARFAFGLFLPAVRDDLPLSTTLSGVISGGAFGGYCVAIVVAAALTERVGPRAVAFTAAVVATTGLALVAVATSPVMLAGAVVFAGLSTGLASPPLAAAVASSVRAERRDGANTLINAGTSVGIALSGPVAMVAGSDWRLAYVVFTVIAAAVAAIVFVVVPAGTPRDPRAAPGPFLPPFTPGVRRLVSATLMTGAASTIVWSFGPELVGESLGWRENGIGTLWIVIGISGLVGAFAGGWTMRFGIDAVHRVGLLTLTAGTLCIAHPGTTGPVALAGGVLFGAAYILLTGVYLVWGTTVLRDRPATGLTIAFLTLAVGQTVGAPLVGLALDLTSASVTVVAFAALTLVAGAIRARTGTP